MRGCTGKHKNIPMAHFKVNILILIFFPGLRKIMKNSSHNTRSWNPGQKSKSVSIELKSNSLLPSYISGNCTQDLCVTKLEIWLLHQRILKLLCITRRQQVTLIVIDSLSQNFICRMVIKIWYYMLRLNMECIPRSQDIWWLLDMVS